MPSDPFLSALWRAKSALWQRTIEWMNRPAPLPAQPSHWLDDHYGNPYHPIWDILGL